jgi:hypothetical protein
MRAADIMADYEPKPRLVNGAWVTVDEIREKTTIAFDDSGSFSLPTIGLKDEMIGFLVTAYREGLREGAKDGEYRLREAVLKAVHPETKTI